MPRKSGTAVTGQRPQRDTLKRARDSPSCVPLPGSRPPATSFRASARLTRAEERTGCPCPLHRPAVQLITGFNIDCSFRTVPSGT